MTGPLRGRSSGAPLDTPIEVAVAPIAREPESQVARAEIRPGSRSQLPRHEGSPTTVWNHPLAQAGQEEAPNEESEAQTPSDRLRQELQTLSRRFASEGTAVLPQLAALAPVATQIETGLQQGAVEQTVADLILLRNYHRFALSVHQANRYRDARTSSEERIQEISGALERTEGVLRTLRAYFRSTVSDQPFVLDGEIQSPPELSAGGRLTHAQLAAQISAELEEYAGLSMDLRHWEQMLEAANGTELPVADRLAHQTALFRAWGRVRNAVTGLIPRDPAAPPIIMDDDAITERLRDLRDGILESVTELDGGEHEGEVFRQLEARLNGAIDNNDTNFLNSLTPSLIQEFLEVSTRARTLETAMAAAEGSQRWLRQCQAAALYGNLGLGAEVRRILAGAQDYLRGLPTTAETVQGLMLLATLYQGADLDREARSLLVQIHFIGSNAGDPQSQETAVLAQAMLQLTEGELAAAERSLRSLPENDRARELLQQLQAGERRHRIAQVAALWQASAHQYVEQRRAEGATDIPQLERELQAAFQEATRRVQSGEVDHFSQALWSINQGGLGSFLESPYGYVLDGLSDLGLSQSAFERRVLRSARQFLREERYVMAAHLAESLRESPTVGDEARAFRDHEIQEAIDTEQLWDQVHGLSYFIPYVNIAVISYDVWAAPEDEFGSTMLDVGLAVVGYGLATRAAGAAESYVVRHTLAEGLSPAALRATGWLAHSAAAGGTMTGFGMVTGAMRSGSTEHLTLGNFAREFGAQMVTFGLLRAVGGPTGRRGAVSQARLERAREALARAQESGVGVEAATARLRAAQWAGRQATVLNWGSRVGALTAGDYLNEGIGFREASDRPFYQRLISSALTDAEMMAAHRVLNGLTRGGMERGQRDLQRYYAERALEHARPRLEEVMGDLEQNGILDGSDPLAVYVRAALEHSVQSTGSSRMAEVLASRAGRRALFAATDGLGLEPSSRAYDMVLSALMLHALTRSTSRGDYLRNLRAMGRQLQSLAPLIEAVGGRMAQTLDQQGQLEGSVISAERFRALQERLTGQLAERVLNGEMSEAELTEIREGLDDGSIEFFVALDLARGDFLWDFRQAVPATVANGTEPATEAIPSFLQLGAGEGEAIVEAEAAPLRLGSGREATRPEALRRRRSRTRPPILPRTPLRDPPGIRPTRRRSGRRQLPLRPGHPPRELTPRRGSPRRSSLIVPTDTGMAVFLNRPYSDGPVPMGQGMAVVTASATASFAFLNPQGPNDGEIRQAGPRPTPSFFRGGSSETVSRMRQDISRSFNRFPPPVAQGLREVLDLKNLGESPLRALHALHSVPSRQAGTLLLALIDTPEARRNVGFLAELTPAAARELVNLISRNPSDDPRGLVRRFFNTPWLFEATEGNGPSRGLLALEALQALQGVEGQGDLMEKITLEYPDAGGTWRIYSPRDRARWRGNVDELIRLGHLQRAARSSDSPDPLIAVNHEFGRVSYRDQAGQRVSREMEGDGVRASRRLQELKSTYDASRGAAAEFSLDSMAGESLLSFQNQARKYAAAIAGGRITGVDYHITARSIAPGVVEFLRDTIPNLTITRYDSITDRVGEVIYGSEPIRLSFQEILETHRGQIILSDGDHLSVFDLPRLEQLRAYDGGALRELFHETYEAFGTPWEQNPPSHLHRQFRHQAGVFIRLLNHLEPEAAEALEMEVLEILGQAPEAWPDPLEQTTGALNELLRQQLTEVLEETPVTQIALDSVDFSEGSQVSGRRGGSNGGTSAPPAGAGGAQGNSGGGVAAARNVGIATAIVTGLSSFFTPEVAHAATDAITTATSGGGFGMGLLSAVLGLGVLAMTQRSGSNGDGPYREPEPPNGSATEVLERIQQTESVLRQFLDAYEPGMEAQAPIAQILPGAIAELQEILRRFRGSPEQVAEVSRAFRRIVFLVLMVPCGALPTEIETGERSESQQEGEQSWVQIPARVPPDPNRRPEILTQETVRFANWYAELQVAQRGVSAEEIEVVEDYLQGIIISEQFHETLLTLARLRDALPEGHEERRHIEGLLEEMHQLSEEWKPWDPRSIRTTLATTGAGLAGLAILLPSVDLLPLGLATLGMTTFGVGLQLFFETRIFLRDVRRLGWRTAFRRQTQPVRTQIHRILQDLQARFPFLANGLQSSNREAEAGEISLPPPESGSRIAPSESAPEEADAEEIESPPAAQVRIAPGVGEEPEAEPEYEEAELELPITVEGQEEAER